MVKAAPKKKPENPFARRSPSNRTVLYLARHGEVVPAEKGAPFTYNGHKDVNLTKEGRRHAMGLVEFLADIPLDAIYSSDLKRSAYSARQVGKAKGMKPVFDERFRELHFGHWEGLSLQTILTRYGKESLLRFKDIVHARIDGGGENLKDLQARVMPALKEALERHRGGTVLLTAHGGVNRIILFSVLGVPLKKAFHLDQSYGCVNRIDFYGPGIKDPVVRYVNHLPYEPEERVTLEMMESKGNGAKAPSPAAKKTPAKRGTQAATGKIPSAGPKVLNPPAVKGQKTSAKRGASTPTKRSRKRI